jgi:hypothetical protein
LSSNIKGIYIDTDSWEGFVEYAVEMGSGAIIYIHVPSFIKVGSSIKTLMGGGGNTRIRKPLKPVFIFFKIRKVG